MHDLLCRASGPSARMAADAMLRRTSGRGDHSFFNISRAASRPAYRKAAWVEWIASKFRADDGDAHVLIGDASDVIITSSRPKIACSRKFRHANDVAGGVRRRPLRNLGPARSSDQPSRSRFEAPDVHREPLAREQRNSAASPACRVGRRTNAGCSSSWPRRRVEQVWVRFDHLRGVRGVQL